eukprot:jgi/Orpsp1_1/1189702/evm.model.d7180000073814.2
MSSLVKIYYQDKILELIKKGDIIKIQSILNKSVKYGIILDMNYIKKDECDFNTLGVACKYKNINIIEVLLDYAIEHNIKININTWFTHFGSLFNYFINEMDSNVIKSILDYFDQQKYIIPLNNNNIHNNFLSSRGSPETYNLLINYADNHNMVMNVNEEIYYKTPLIYAIEKYNSYNIVQIIIDYANNHNIILDINKKDRNSPLLLAFEKNNIK